LPTGKALQVMACIQQHQAHKLAEPRDGAAPGEGVGVVWLGGVEHGQLQGAAQAVIVVNPGEVPCETLVHGRVPASLCHAVAVGLVGELLATLGEVVLARGMRGLLGAAASF
jgi:hypothetical protein